MSGGGVGVTESGGNDELSSCRGRLFAAAVSSGGGCGRSRPVNVVELEVPLDRVDPGFCAGSLVAEEGLVLSIDGSLGTGT